MQYECLSASKVRHGEPWRLGKVSILRDALDSAVVSTYSYCIAATAKPMSENSEIVTSRTVFFVGGYDPKTPQAYFTRMQREMVRFEALWGTTARMSAVSVTSDGNIGTVTIEADSDAAGEHWKTRTRFHFLVLDKLVVADLSRPLPIRLGHYLVAFGNFMVSGTGWRMIAKAWRFGLYFLMPFAAVLLFMALGLVAALSTAPWLGVWAILLGVVVYGAAQRFLGERWPVNHLMDLWSFSDGFIGGRRPDAEALMQRFAQAIVDRLREEPSDELILIGHSTGGLLILDIAARALAIEPEIFRRAGQSSILTLGSTALKAGLHPAGDSTRDGVRRIQASGTVSWVEIQCLTDVINFYKSNPVEDIGLASRPDFPLVRQVKIRDMLDASTYRRIKRNFFRVHYQYVFGNTKPYWYDFFQICCGPIPLVRRAENRILGSSAQDSFS